METVKQVILDRPGRGRVYNSILETVGNTPLVRINRLAEESGCMAEVLAKLEFFNPLGSPKDRIVLSMLEALETDGTIGPGSAVVEPTTGNTGVGLAFACAVKGYRCILTMPESVPVERRRLMRFLGAELVLTPGDKGLQGAIEKAKEIIGRTDRAVMPWQLGHPAYPDIHRRTTAEEIWADTDGVIDAVVIGIGTGGGLTGIAQALKQRRPDIRVIAVEPEGSSVLSGSPHASHLVQDLESSLIDETMLVSDADAVQTARNVAAWDGIPAGISSGAALACAVRIARRPEMKGRTIVTVLPSSAERYLSSSLFEGYVDG